MLPQDLGTASLPSLFPDTDSQQSFTMLYCALKDLAGGGGQLAAEASKTLDPSPFRETAA
jgi:hypothetical protein